MDDIIIDITPEKKEYKLTFAGKGSELFGIMLVNWILTLVTFGLYYPWAKVRELKYIYSSTALNKDQFEFHGTGRELFKGYVKVIIFFGLLLFVFGVFTYMQMHILAIIAFYLGIFAIMPLAIHGSYRYRMSRSSWRGIRFGYRGDRGYLIKNFFLWLFYTIISLGIYGSWLMANLRNYVFSNIRFGSIQFKCNSRGLDYFIINLKGYIFTVFTLGIYIFWWQKNLFEFYVNCMTMEKEEQKIKLTSTATTNGFFELIIVNLIIVVFTFGLGYPLTVIRNMEFFAGNIKIEGDIDLDSIIQTEEDYNDALGADMTDFFNINILF